ncbi:thioredoxin-disulfide reductase [bacterium]|nr:thioredoxin-disulfide reductase [bacterium]
MTKDIETKLWDSIIVGAGPAGLTAAIYTSRSNMSTLLFEKAITGGLVSLTHEIENYPGFIEPISGPELMRRFEAQAKRLGAQVEFSEIKKIEDAPDVHPAAKKLTDWTGKEFFAKTVIVATGSQPNRLPAKGAEDFFGRGVSYCATCDANFFVDRHCIVVGGGDAALEEALYLTGFCSQITLVHRRQGFRATPRVVERARNHPKMEFVLDSVVEEVLADDFVKGARCKNVVTGEEFTIDCDGIFVFIGYSPVTEWLKGYLPLNDNGEITVDYQMQTAKDGVYACGDVIENAQKQAVISAGNGCIAALSARRFIENLE